MEDHYRSDWPSCRVSMFATRENAEGDIVRSRLWLYIMQTHPPSSPTGQNGYSPASADSCMAISQLLAASFMRRMSRWSAKIGSCRGRTNKRPNLRGSLQYRACHVPCRRPGADFLWNHDPGLVATGSFAQLVAHVLRPSHPFQHRFATPHRARRSEARRRPLDPGGSRLVPEDSRFRDERRRRFGAARSRCPANTLRPRWRRPAARCQTSGRSGGPDSRTGMAWPPERLRIHTRFFVVDNLFRPTKIKVTR